MPSLFECCCGAIEEAAQEVQLTAAAARAPAPLELDHGYANEDGAARGMAPPRCGAFEVVNKNRTGEMIAVLVGQHAADIVLKGRDPNGYLDTHLSLMPDQTVLSAKFSEELFVLQVVALFYLTLTLTLTPTLTLTLTLTLNPNPNP